MDYTILSKCRPRKRRAIVGYLPWWQGEVDSGQLDMLTHANYAFLQTNTDGSLQPLENPAKLQQLVSAASASSGAFGDGVDVGISIGGWLNGDNSTLEGMASDPVSCDAFVANMVGFVQQYNLDYVDMDWEFPQPGQQATDFATMMCKLNDALESIGKYLTAAVSVYGTNADGVLNQVFDCVQFLSIMAYDVTPADHANMQITTDALNYWSGRGLPKDKTVLGVPFFPKPYDANGYSYADMVTLNQANACLDQVVINGVTYYYNGIETIREKANIALDCCGIMSWELSNDTTDSSSLLLAMHEIMTGQTPTYQCA